MYSHILGDIVQWYNNHIGIIMLSAHLHKVLIVTNSCSYFIKLIKYYLRFQTILCDKYTLSVFAQYFIHYLFVICLNDLYIEVLFETA